MNCVNLGFDERPLVAAVGKPDRDGSFIVGHTLALVYIDKLDIPADSRTLIGNCIAYLGKSCCAFCQQ